MIKITERKQIIYINKFPVFVNIVRTKSFHPPDSYIRVETTPSGLKNPVIRVDNNVQFNKLFSDMIKKDLEAWSLSRKK